MPDAVARVIRETCVLAREPYLVLPRDPRSTLYAVGTNGKTDFMLHLGDPFEEQKVPTWREHWSAGRSGQIARMRDPAGRDEQERASQYFDEYESIDVDDEEAVADWWREHVGDPEEDPVSIVPDDEIDGWAYENWEFRQEVYEGPMASAYRRLEELPLDDDRGLGGENPLGELRFVEGDRPGSNLTYVEAPDLATLACLQNRLNELGQNLAIEIKSW